MKSGIIFFDSQYLKGTAALTDQLLPWHLPGVGLFETMRIYEGTVVLKDAHIKRVLKGLERGKIKHRFTVKKLSLWLAEVIQKNSMKDGRSRLCVWHDGKTHISIVVQDYQVFTEEIYKKGFSARSFSMGEDEQALTPGVKTIKYGPFLDYYHQARNYGLDEAILCNNNNSVVEASRANIFWVSRGVLYTPELKTGCLNGITRDAVMTMSENNNISVRFIAAPVEQLKKAEEAFLTNSLMGVMPLTRIDDQSIGAGAPGPVTILTRNSYHKKVLQANA